MKKTKRTIMKRTLVFALCFFLTLVASSLACNSASAGEGATLRGDANADDAVDMNDIVLTGQFVLGYKKQSDQGMLNADVNDNQTVDIHDGVVIERWLLKQLFELKDTPYTVSQADDIEFYLKIVSASSGVISNDGRKIRFENAAEAKGAELVIQEFIKAPAALAVQSVGSTFSVSDKAISLQNGASYSQSIGDEKNYTLNGVNVTTGMFVCCFSRYVSERVGVRSGLSSLSQWNHSSDYYWTHSGPDQLSVIWTAEENEEKTNLAAHFANGRSDAFPFAQFEAKIGNEIMDGAYSVDVLDSFEHPDNGTQQNTYLLTPDKNKYLVTKHNSIMIQIGTLPNPLTFAETQEVAKDFSTSAQTAALAAAENGEGTVTYAITGQQDSSGGTVNYFSLSGTTLNIAAGTPAGTYTVVVRASAAGNNDYYSGEKDSTVTVTIGKVANPLTFAGTQKVVKDFSTSVQTATLDAAENGVGTVTYAISGQQDSSGGDVKYFSLDDTTLNIDASTPAGTYTVTVRATAAGDGNYNSGEKDSTVTVTIGMLANPLTFAGTQKVEKAFSDSAQTAALAAAEKGAGTVTYAITGQQDSSGGAVKYFSLDGTTLSIAAGTPAGSYTVIVRATAAGDDDYNSGTKDSTVTVTIGQPDVISDVKYTAVSVQNREHTIGDGKDTVIKVTRSPENEKAYALYTGSTMDGKAIPASGCSAAEGSLVLTIKSAYLDTLSAGTHTVRLSFQDGYAETDITIKDASPVPKTGDSSHPLLWLGLILLGVAGLAGTVVPARRKAPKRK